MTGQGRPAHRARAPARQPLKSALPCVTPMLLDFYEMAIRILAALAAGALIGYERSYRGRPAGFRTHALVCMASAMLMLVTVYEAHWVRSMGEAPLDPPGEAPGIMSGIGFLGSGGRRWEG